MSDEQEPYVSGDPREKVPEAQAEGAQPQNEQVAAFLNSLEAHQELLKALQKMATRFMLSLRPETKITLRKMDIDSEEMRINADLAVKAFWFHGAVMVVALLFAGILLLWAWGAFKSGYENAGELVTLVAGLFFGFVGGYGAGKASTKKWG